MAEKPDLNKIKEALSANPSTLPSATQGNSQNFIFLLKKYLENLKTELDAKFVEVSKVANASTDAPDTMTQQLKNCAVREVRVGTAISLILTWDYSDIENYDSAEIYIKEAKGDSSSSIDWSAITAERSIRTPKTNTCTVDNINAGYVYQIVFVGKNIYGTVSDKAKAPTLIYAVSAMNNSPDAPTNFEVYFTRTGVLWTWRQPPKLEYSYSELRVDQNVGNKVGLLEVTQDTKSEVLPPTREGTAYLYNKGYGSKYSTPASTTWSKPIPTAPQTLTITKQFQGLLISYPPIPEDCIGICISINGMKYYSSDDTFNYYTSTGTYTIKAAYYDVFGEGTWTKEQTVSTVEKVPILDDQITLENVDDALKNAIKNAQDSVGKIDELNKDIDDINKQIDDMQTGSGATVEGLNSAIKELQRNVTDLKAADDGFRVTDTELSNTITANKQAQDGENETFKSQIKQNADGVSSIVANLGGPDENGGYKTVTQIQQNADSLRALVVANKESQDAQNAKFVTDIQANAGSISSVTAELDGVQDNLNDPDKANAAYKAFSSIKQSITGIETTVADNQKKLSSQIEQNAGGISSIVANLNSYDTATKTYGAFSQFKQTVDGISSTVTSNKTAQDTQNQKYDAYASSIKQNADSISTVVSNLSSIDKANENYGAFSSITQTTGQISSTVSGLSKKVDDNKTAQDKENQTLHDADANLTKTVTSQITQTKDSLTTLITEKVKGVEDNLNDPKTSKYTAITQLLDAINLRVKSGELISQINLSKEGVRIAGKLLELDGDTTIKGVLRLTSDNLADGTIVGTKIAGDTITTGNIAANAITAGQIASNAVTSDKIKANAVTSDKIEAGAVTADKIKAGSITSDKLTAGAVTADKLAANEIRMAGALKVVGGQVTLDENGLTVKESNGGSVIFNQNGMSFADTLGNIFAGVGRFCTGQVNDGDIVTFANPWDIVPSVFLFPTGLQTSVVQYTNVNIYQQVMPVNVSKNGFQAICRSILKAGSGANVSINNQFAVWGANDDNNKWYWYDIPIPESATSATISFAITTTANATLSTHDEWDLDLGKTNGSWEVKLDGVVAQAEYGGDDTGPLYISGVEPESNGSTSTSSISKTINRTINLSFSNKKTITLTVEFWGDIWGTGAASPHSLSAGSATLFSYSFNTSVDTIVSRGSCGFIAVDPNTVPFTVTKGQ